MVLPDKGVAYYLRREALAFSPRLIARNQLLR
jgi:hypothetical protein